MSSDRRGMLTERPSILVGGSGGFPKWLSFLSFISATAQSLTSGAMRTHFDKCGTIDWLGFPVIEAHSLIAT